MGIEVIRIAKTGALQHRDCFLIPPDKVQRKAQVGGQDDSPGVEAYGLFYDFKGFLRAPGVGQRKPQIAVG